MTGMNSLKTGELIALRPGHRRGDDAATVPVRPERPLFLGETSVDLSNVVPFVRPAEQEAVQAAPVVALPADAARAATSVVRERGRLAAFIALSLLVHGALIAVLWREPDPLASIGLPVISVEIVVGATAPAGAAPVPGENETQAAASPTDPQPTEVAREAEQKATEQPQDVPVAKQEAAPEETTPLERQADELQPDPKPAVAMVESPKPDQATAPPPDAMDVTLLPQPEQKPVKPAEAKPVEQKSAPKQVQRKPEPEPKQRIAARPTETKAAEPARIAAPTKERPSERARASAPANPANNLGVGRSDYDTNYRGLVAAHLARYKQYPADARSRGDRGTAAVTFSIGGGGGVTSVSLARSSGIASIDQEVQAMVRRASPFPAPPGGRSQSFTVPVSFHLN
jgi:periplasmic protein TonB